MGPQLFELHRAHNGEGIDGRAHNEEDAHEDGHAYEDPLGTQVILWHQKRAEQRDVVGLQGNGNVEVLLELHLGDIVPHCASLLIS